MNAPVTGLGPIAIPQEFQDCFDSQRAAYLALAGWLTWTARRHLAQVFRAAVARPSPGDADEAMSYRAAVWGFLLSVAVLSGWFVVSGVRLWVALVVILVYLSLIHISEPTRPY